MPFDPAKPYNDLPDLPPKAEIETVAILKQSIKTRHALAQLNAAIQNLPNPDVLIMPISLQEARDSSAIENIVTTDDALFRQSELPGEPKDPAVKEALRYRTALYDAYSKLRKRPVGANTAIEICRTLTGIDIDVRAVPGTTLRNIGTGETIYTPPIGQDRIRTKLSNWEKFIHEETNIDALVRIAVQHYQFEAIHPFFDGNGRTGRILNVLLLLELGILDKPVIYQCRSILATRDLYYKKLHGVTAQGAWLPWIEYYLLTLEDSAQKSAMKSFRIQMLINSTEKLLHSKGSKLPSKELIVFLFGRPYCRIGELVDAGLAKRQTAASYLNSLSALGVLEEIRSGREKIFVHKKFLELLTTDGLGVTKYPDSDDGPSELLFAID